MRHWQYLGSGPGQFNPDDFETYEIAFMNLLAQMYRSNKEVLSMMCIHLLCPFHLPMKPKGIAMYQLSLTGSTFGKDNKVVYCLLKSFLMNIAGWT